MFKFNQEKKMKKIKTKINRRFNKYYKARENASLELFLLLDLYKHKFPHLDEQTICKKVLSSLKTNDKNLNYSGASLVPLTFLTGIFLFSVNNTFFNELNPNSIGNKIIKLLGLLKSANLDIGQYILFYIQIILLVLLFFLPIILLLYFYVYLYDQPQRKKIINNSIMIELLNEKINDLDKKASY